MVGLKEADGHPDQAAKSDKEDDRSGCAGERLDRLLDPFFMKLPSWPRSGEIVSSPWAIDRYRVGHRFHGG